MKIRNWIVSFGLLVAYQYAAACTDPSLTNELTTIETKKLLSNAPTFKQAWQDKAITIEFKDSKVEGNQCLATLVLHLPQADLDEANQHLDQNPAKRILTAAQGYAVPDSAKVEVPFSYQIVDGKAAASNPNTPELKALHNNIEYTYQLLAQLRIHMIDNATNQIAWSDTDLAASTQRCLNNKETKSKGASFCGCLSEKLAKAISPRQMELVNYIETQPFSVATGSMDGFNKLNEKISEACSAN
jgi:hypothetical protein